MQSRTNAGVTRRRFNQGLVTAVAGTMAAPAFLRGQSLNNKLNIAVIGAGGRGAADTASVAGENIIALCDVNAKSLEGAAKRYPAARQYSDFRKLFEHANDFDAVVIATCEHTHAAATMLALKHNKHVYCEKPLTHDIWEARQIRESAAKVKVATQMGIQIHATENYRRVVEIVQSGAIGPVREAHVWVSRAWGLQSEEASKRNHDLLYVTDRPKGDKPAPDSLNWDLWLGPAAYRPYDDVYVPGPKWYRWWDFGNGTMSDLGSHWNDLPFWALKLKTPLTIEASGPAPHPEIAPASMSATYEYGARGELPPVKFTWHQGENKPEIWKTGGIPKWGDGCLFIGDKGMLLADYDKHVLLPEKEFADFKRPAPTIARSPGHHEEWIEACKTGKPTAADFQYSGLLTEANHLGNVAFRVGKKLKWDSVALRATNAPEADAYIRRERRAGWEL
ncbi:MAG: gfo/Idh/MocA family oxidoreductase [Phycisphaerales bacterium]|nr:gfo/Idh/MocA family oxidoreductase [Phycisphaerales bacterium]